MSITDASLCLIYGETRDVWINPGKYRWWSRDPGNCDCSNNSTICSTQLKFRQNQFHKLVLQNKVASSIQNVSGLRTQANLYSYYARGNKNGNTKPHTFATQNTRGYTNFNTNNLPINGFINTLPNGPFTSPSTRAIAGIQSRQNLLCPLNFRSP
jgi:hypothetical protein